MRKTTLLIAVAFAGLTAVPIVGQDTSGNSTNSAGASSTTDVNAALDKSSDTGVLPNADAEIQADTTSNVKTGQSSQNQTNGQASAEVETAPQSGSVSANANVDSNTNMQAGDSNTDVSGSASAMNASDRANDSWRYRDFNGRRWYWNGDRSDGYWSYMDNKGQWVRFQGSNSAMSNSSQRVSGYRGNTSSQSSSSFDGPYYFDQNGRRYYQQGSAYRLDESWNSNVWTEGFRDRNRTYMNNNGSIYSRLNVNGNLLNRAGVGASTNLNGAINSGLRQGGVLNGGNFNGSVNQGARVGGAIGNAVGGQAGARAGAAIGGAIDRN